MIKILYDHQAFSLQRYGGISRYFGNLYHFLNDSHEINISISALTSKNHYIKEYSFPLSNNISKVLFKKDRKIYKWNKKYSKYIISKSEYDILHPTYYDPYFLANNKKPFVITVHDMIHEIMPEFFQPNNTDSENKKKIIHQADKIIAISESTKNDILNLYNIDSDKIHVIHHGYYDVSDISAHNVSINNNPPFLLYVGDRNTYKNFYRFLQSVTPILQKNKDLQLICAGGMPFQSAELQAIMRTGASNRIFQKNVTNLELKILYKKASLFIFPSLYEGFGFPLIESFANNCAVVCSNTSSFKEIAGNAAIYFNPFEIEDITNCIEMVLEDSNCRDRLIKNGEEQIKKFTIEKCASLTKETYQSML